jgi:glyoxylase-like metal-dependent hydrolase (beta-lactamase superfamily II)
MVRILIFIATLLSAAAAVAAPPAPEILRISDRVYMLMGLEEMPNADNQGLIGNSTLIVGESGAILVDSGFTYEIGLRLREAAAKITRKPITRVINTHAHGDHFLGNSAFPEAEIISSERCRDSVKREGMAAVALIESLTGRSSPATKPVPATRSFMERTRTRVELEGVRMDIWVPRPAHTPGDLLVYLPDDGVLVAGDVLANGSVPNLRDGNASGWLATLDEIRSMAVTTALPGHGRPMEKTEIDKFSKRMFRLYADIEKGYKRGLSDSGVRETLDLAEWRTLKRFDDMGMLINRMYVEIEEKNF